MIHVSHVHLLFLKPLKRISAAERGSMPDNIEKYQSRKTFTKADGNKNMNRLTNTNDIIEAAYKSV